MSFRTKNKVKARERVMKSRAEVKNLSRFERRHGLDIPRPKQPFRGPHDGKTIQNDGR